MSQREGGEDFGAAADAAHYQGEPDRLARETETAARCDRSVRIPALLGVWCALMWLLVGSIFGDLASFKLHSPWLLADSPYLTFGRIRPAHLNSMVYGWASNAMIAVALWLLARLLRAPLRWAPLVLVGIGLWNIGVGIGIYGLLDGVSDGLEWLEMHRWYADPFLLVGGALIALPVCRTLVAREVKHLYVSVWYVVAAFVWFPIIFLVGNMPWSGIQSAAANWFYAHNALGLWFTAISLGAIYYLIPKVLGRPIYSYWLSLVGFWSLAFFYSLNGMHHLIGGPLPSWMLATSIVASVMMVIPVIVVAVNHHMTMVGRFSAMRYSPTLTFVVLGAMAYTGVSLQGVMQSLVEVNRLTHFTHWTVAHAHMGVYSFVTFTLFGSLYYILPRVLLREWPSAWMIRWHLWLVLFGIATYIIGLAIGGVLQGLALNDAKLPFEVSVARTLPWLWVRSGAGVILTLGHLLFVAHVIRLTMAPRSRGAIPAWYELAPILVRGEHGKVREGSAA